MPGCSGSSPWNNHPPGSHDTNYRAVLRSYSEILLKYLPHSFQISELSLLQKSQNLAFSPAFFDLSEYHTAIPRYGGLWKNTAVFCSRPVPHRSVFLHRTYRSDIPAAADGFLLESFHFLRHPAGSAVPFHLVCAGSHAVPECSVAQRNAAFPPVHQNRHLRALLIDRDSASWPGSVLLSAPAPAALLRADEHRSAVFYFLHPSRYCTYNWVYKRGDKSAEFWHAADWPVLFSVSPLFQTQRLYTVPRWCVASLHPASSAQAHAAASDVRKFPPAMYKHFCRLFYLFYWCNDPHHPAR